MAKKFTWTVDKMIQALSELINFHDEFLRKKKLNRHFEVYDEVAKIVGGRGRQVIKDFLKNLGREYRAIQTKLSASGAETDEPDLRNSHALYDTYEEYYHLFFPVGGAVRPHVIVTATNIRKLGESNKRHLDGIEDDDDESHSDTFPGTGRSLSPCPSIRSACTSSQTSVSKAKKTKVMKEEQFLSNSASFQQTYLDLVREQNNTLKTIADNMVLQSKSLESIAVDLEMLKGGYFVTHIIQTRVPDKDPIANTESP